MKRKTYSREYKQEAVKLVLSEGLKISEAARNLGISANALRNWVVDYKKTGEKAFPGNGNARDEELQRLKAEVRRLRLERDILKKATAFFAGENQ